MSHPGDDEDVETPAARIIEWAARTVTQGEILAAFAEHCRDELDDVEVVESSETCLVTRWRRETSRLELHRTIARSSLGVDEGVLTLLIGDFTEHLEDLVEAFADDAALRGRVALLDLGRLEKVSAVRSSVFVYLEWFLRDAYGVKLQPAAAFTQRLIDRGIISLGFG